MVDSSISEDRLKAVVKEALVELLDERKELFYELVGDVIEHLTLAGSPDEQMSAQQHHLFDVLEGKA